MNEIVDIMKKNVRTYIESLVDDFMRATSQEEREKVAAAIRSAFADGEANYDAVVKDGHMYAARCCKLIDVLHHAIAALRTTGQLADAIESMARKAAEHQPEET